MEAERIAELENRLARTQKALEEVITAKLVEMDGDRSRKVLEEREACARVVEDVMIGIGQVGADNPLGMAAEMIRRRR